MDRPRALHHRAIPRQQTHQSFLPRPPRSDNHGGYRVTEEFGITENAIKKIPNATLYLIPGSPMTAGHGTAMNAKL
jgi:hypothetical protein